MNRFRIYFAALVVLFASATLLANGRYYEVTYPPSQNTDELQLPVTYTIWLPEGVSHLRGIIVHQHGCGAPACQGGATAAYDLHWQALARKWHCALLGPSYGQRDDQDCSLWADPRKGSDRAFLHALDDLADKSSHPELKQAPWALWGHSGGGYWANRMLRLHPQRIVAVWFRSGAASQKDANDPQVPRAVFEVPMMCNPGVKEKDDKRFKRVWTDTLATFRAYCAQGAPIGFAPDPRTSHECGDSRYLAIPFFEACLAMRLPDEQAPNQALRPVDLKQAWLAKPLSDNAVPAATYKGDPKEAVWLPNETVAKDWMEYVASGEVSDLTAPPAPSDLKVRRKGDGAIELTWDADADLESGLAGFIIQRDAETIAKIPEKPVGHFGRPLFQTMSFHDTPENPLPAMRFEDKNAPAGGEHKYTVIAVNAVGLRSKPADAEVK